MAETLSYVADEKTLANTNLQHFMTRFGFANYSALHSYSCQHRYEFWQRVADTLGIIFKKPGSLPNERLSDPKYPHWFQDATLNITDSCFLADKNSTAIVVGHENGALCEMTFGELKNVVDRLVHSLRALALPKGAAIAIAMPMHEIAVALYLAIVRAGFVVVGIADSFAAEEIAVRLQIANALVLFTQDFIVRGEKQFPLYEKLLNASPPTTVVLSLDRNKIPDLHRSNDLAFQDFLTLNRDDKSSEATPEDTMTILFSSGTTGTPKAIPWTQITPLKCGSDAYFHLNVKAGDRFAWPTNLGWMMGPWLIFAAFLNRASIALFEGSPLTTQFGQFIERANVTHLGVIPSMVAAWRSSGCMEKSNWQQIHLFASTGECSNPSDMAYLMQLGQHKPIIEYCGGTEIGGAYITATLFDPCIPSTFTTPALGLDFLLLNEAGEFGEEGEVALIPPCVGLSERLLNHDHDAVYYHHMPQGPAQQLLRRHGDKLVKIAEHRYRALGRVDDTMNLGGIKTSAVEIERVMNTISEIQECAAIASPPKEGGPDRLVIYVVPAVASVNIMELKQKMQKLIKEHLNPLFKLHDVIFIEKLPRTASNKIMRRVLRQEYSQCS